MAVARRPKTRAIVGVGGASRRALGGRGFHPRARAMLHLERGGLLRLKMGLDRRRRLELPYVERRRGGALLREAAEERDEHGQRRVRVVFAVGRLPA